MTEKIKADANGTMVGEGVKFERIRRITGYLTRVDRACNAKKAEMSDRIPHKLR